MAAFASSCSGEEGTNGGESARLAGEEDGGATGSPAIDETTPVGKAVVSLRPFLDGSRWRGHQQKVLSGWRGERQPMTDLILETYRRREHRPVFVDGLWPSDAAAAMVKALREIPSHGLPHSRYRPKVVVPLFAALALDPAASEETLTEPTGDLERLAELERQMPRSVYKTPRKSERVPEVTYRALRTLPDTSPLEPEHACLLRELYAAAAGKTRGIEERIASRCKLQGAALDAGLAKVSAVVDDREEHTASLALLDALLVQAFYQWVLDFSIDRRVHPFKSYGPVNRSRLPRERSDELLESLGDLDDGEAFAERLRGHLPESPEYDLLRRALVRYVELMDTKTVPELRVAGWLKKGAEGSTVEALQRRLTVEGYYDGEVSGSFDDATHRAVAEYQRAHGLADGGVVGGDTVESLNLPFDWRVKQLLVALGRWRESPLSRRSPGDFYVRVNLPSFELEVVEEGRTVKRHKVIVGSNRRVPDAGNDGVVWHARRTPIFDTKITEVVLNPNWIVPEAIRIDEILPKAAKSPTYLSENNFKQVGDLLVQGPGETNPLGVVKLTLESTDSIYLHDTDKRLLFREVRRDFSHGCVRVDEPEALAKLLVSRDGGDATRVDRRIGGKAPVPMKLAAHVPIFVEYCTVGMTADGQPIFYDDIYGYDVAYWKKRTPITRRFP